MSEELDYTRDAVFLPGKIHYSEDQLYIIQRRRDVANGTKLFVIKILDLNVLNIAEDVKYNCKDFFRLLPDFYHGSWHYATESTSEYRDLLAAYPDADFIEGTSGDQQDEFDFIVSWARGEHTSSSN